jgi:hypothetical protein
MTEQTPRPGTGVPGVDRVLAEMDRLDELPLDDHLATFERVHHALRSALDAPDADDRLEPGLDLRADAAADEPA